MSLTYAEIAALPDGTKLRITWSGGNGPHVYTLHRHGPDDLYAAMGSGHDDPMWHYNPLDDFIGDGPPYTVVELARTPETGGGIVTKNLQAISKDRD